MLEKNIESRLKKGIEDCIPGAMCRKWVCPGYNGVPDRIVLLPGGRVVFVETKAPGKKERALQVAVQNRLRELGFIVFSSVRTLEQVEDIIEVCKRLTDGR